MKKLLCKIKKHVIDGAYQGYYPDIGLDEVCANCGITLHKLTEKEFRQQFRNMKRYTKNEIDGFVRNWKGE